MLAVTSAAVAVAVVDAEAVVAPAEARVIVTAGRASGKPSIIRSPTMTDTYQ